MEGKTCPAVDLPVYGEAGTIAYSTPNRNVALACTSNFAHSHETLKGVTAVFTCEFSYKNSCNAVL